MSEIYTVLKTDTKGIAVFSNKVYIENEIIGEYIVSSKTGDGRRLPNGMFESGILGRYCNHNDNPNTKLVTIEDGTVLLIACEPINVGDEIMTNYVEVEKILEVPHSVYYSERFTNVKLINFGKDRV